MPPPPLLLAKETADITMMNIISAMDDLYVFDGNNKPDRVDRVAIDYHRVTKIKPKIIPEGVTWEYATWDYSEKLVLDRKSETLEHTQNIGSGCVVSRKYYVQDGVVGLLDAIDTEDLFGEIEGNPDDVIENPLETQDYTITVDFKTKKVRGELSREPMTRRHCRSPGAILSMTYGSLCGFMVWVKYSIQRSTEK